ncbi:hypothetical protein Tco_0805309 [Tanacetum coccineum]
MDDPNITMKEYIRLKEEKAQKRGKVFNWETAKYAITFNDEVSSKTLSCEPTVSSLNDEIDFRILFDDYDDEDYTVIFKKISFSYKKFCTNDLKMDSENDNEKVMPSLPSPEPAISCFDDLDFFKDFENEFPAIVYNDTLTSKSDLLTEPILNPQHVDEFDLKNETSLSEYDEEEQNVLYFNDIFPFNAIHPNDLKLDEDNDDNEIDIIQSSEVRMTKVIKGEFEKIKNVKVEDVSLTCDTSLEVFNNEVNRLSGMDDDLFTYEVDIANIPCDSKMDDDSEHEADDDMGYEPSDVAFTERLGLKFFNYKTMDHYTMKALWIYWIRGDDEVELTHEESSDDKDEVAEDYKWYEALEDSKLKDEALRNKAIMEGFINEGDDESHYKQERRWDIYTNYDDAYEINHENNEKEELCEVHELPVYSFNNDEEYVAVKEEEYDDLTITREEACQAYQEIFRIINEGWMVTRAE